MVGCPYGQEIELLTPGVMLIGQDFFWTLARPLAEFEVGEEAGRLAAEAWKRFLEMGKLTQGQTEAGTARSSAKLVELLERK